MRLFRKERGAGEEVRGAGRDSGVVDKGSRQGRGGWCGTGRGHLGDGAAA